MRVIENTDEKAASVRRAAVHLQHGAQVVPPSYQQRHTEWPALQM